jgi:hypothetical protein
MQTWKHWQRAFQLSLQNIVVPQISLMKKNGLVVKDPFNGFLRQTSVYFHMPFGFPLLKIYKSLTAQINFCLSIILKLVKFITFSLKYN